MEEVVHTTTTTQIDHNQLLLQGARRQSPVNLQLLAAVQVQIVVPSPMQ